MAHTPTPPEISCHLGDCVVVFADSAADLSRRLAREGPFDLERLLREAPGVTVGIGAGPPALAPHQAHRSSAGWQVPDLDDATPAPGRHHAAGRTAGHGGRRLDEDPHLAVLLTPGKHGDVLHLQQRAGITSTVAHALCPPFSLVFQPQGPGGLGALVVDAYGRVTGVEPPHASTRRPHEPASSGTPASRGSG